MKKVLVSLALAVSSVAHAGEPPPVQPSSIIYRDEAIIHADAHTVWDILLDLPRYSEWNPWIVYAHGPAVEDTSVPVGVLLNGHVLDMAYLMVKIEPGKRFCTQDQGVFAFFVPGSRCRMIETLPDGSTRIWQELQVDGVLNWLADLTMGATVRAGMHAEIQALKARAESR